MTQTERDRLFCLLQAAKKQITLRQWMMRAGREDLLPGQIARQEIRSGLRCATVRVEQRLGATLAVRFQQRYLTVQECEPSQPSDPKKTLGLPFRQPTGGRRHDWNRNFDLRSGPKIWQAALESGARLGRATGRPRPPPVHRRDFLPPPAPPPCRHPQLPPRFPADLQPLLPRRPLARRRRPESPVHLLCENPCRHLW